MTTTQAIAFRAVATLVGLLGSAVVVLRPPRLQQLDMAEHNRFEALTIAEKGLWLYLGVLYLGATVEYTESNKLVPAIEGRSSLARMGLQVHVTAGFGDNGFCGEWTLELTVVHPLRVYAGMRVCQICYTPLIGMPTEYAGKYQQQRGPQPSYIWRELN